MKKKFIGLLLLLVLTGCAGLADYSYDVAGNYELSRSSAHQVAVVPKDGWQSDSEIIPPKVVKIAWDEQFVIAEQQLLMSDGEPTDEYAYWVLDTKARQSYGPFTNEEQLKEEMMKMEISSSLQLKDIEFYKE